MEFICAIIFSIICSIFLPSIVIQILSTLLCLILLLVDLLNREGVVANCDSVSKTVDACSLSRVDEDRISSLSNALIHRILSFMDAKYAVQTTLLSTRWNHLWKSMPIINLNSYYFNQPDSFVGFVTQFLSHRYNNSPLFKLNCTVETLDFMLDEIAVYGALHNLQCLHISSQINIIPPSVFISQSLKELSITSIIFIPNVPKSSWNLPALTTLYLARVRFTNDNGSRYCDLDLFSNLLNLKNLSLVDCHTDELQVFYITCPQLENLQITINSHRKNSCKYMIVSPSLSSFIYKGNQIPLISISPELLNCLDKVYIDVCFYDLFWEDETKQMVCQRLINMFHQLRDAKFVTLTLHTIRLLSVVFEMLRNQPSPFCKMECLTIERNYWQRNSAFPTALLTYLCNRSPCCNVINECNRLKLVAGNYYIPKKDKLKPLGEDACFICKEYQTIGVADGVGGWAKRGVDAGEYARELVSNIVFSIGKKYKEGENVDPKFVLKEAFLETKSKGSSTACIVTLKNVVSYSYLQAASIGDSRFVVVRDGKIAYKSPIQQSRFNKPYQIGNDGTHSPESAMDLVFPVKGGDIVVVGTDGLFDNVYDSEIEYAVNADMKYPAMLQHPERLAGLIGRYAFRRAKDKKFFSPYASAAQRLGLHRMGGKYDDITVVVAYIVTCR